MVLTDSTRRIDQNLVWPASSPATSTQREQPSWLCVERNGLADAAPRRAMLSQPTATTNLCVRPHGAAAETFTAHVSRAAAGVPPPTSFCVRPERKSTHTRLQAVTCTPPGARPVSESARRPSRHALKRSKRAWLPPPAPPAPAPPQGAPPYARPLRVPTRCRAPGTASADRECVVNPGQSECLPPGRSSVRPSLPPSVRTHSREEERVHTNASKRVYLWRCGW